MSFDLQAAANNIFDLLFSDTPTQSDNTDPTPTTPTTTTDSEPYDMRIITANLRHDMTDAQTRKGATLLKGKGSIIGFQEVQDPHNHKAVAEGLPDFKFVGAGTEDPIGYNPDLWTLIHWDKELVHNGLAGASPNRWNVFAIFQSKLRPELPQFFHINTHMDVKSQTSKLASPAWRAQMWDKHHTMLNKRIHAFGDMPGFITLDGNAPDMTLTDVKWRADHGIDKIGVKQGAGMTIKKKGTFLIPTPSDHDALGLVAQLVKNA